jgi:hypothetical protein
VPVLINLPSTLGLPPYPPFPHSVSTYAHPQYSARLSAARRGVRPFAARCPPGCPPSAGGPPYFKHIYVDIDKAILDRTVRTPIYVPVAGPRYQPPCFKGGLRETWDLRRRTEIIPVKDPHTRIKPLALASGHGLYITVTPERTILPVGEWPLHIAVINL